MPELPEVETMCRGIAAVAGGRIVDVRRPPCRRRPIVLWPRWPRLRERAVGHVIINVGRVGKRVVLRLSSGDSLVIEPRMTGLVLLADPPTIEHLRLSVELKGCAEPRLQFWDRRGLGVVRLVKAAEYERFYGAARVGPDALSISAGELLRRLAASRRAVKVALLDQRALAGVGNLYASEILHLAGIHPARRCDALGADEWSRLHDALRSILTAAIRHEGSTLSDGTYRNALNGEGAYQQYHRVYDRADRPCPACGGPIARIVQAQRSTFYCPQCQPLRRRRAAGKPAR